MFPEDRPHQIVESIVLTNILLLPDQIDTNAFTNALESLISLGLEIHISAGLAIDKTYFHVLHCRFNSYFDLKAFFDHPEYKRVVANFVTPSFNDPPTKAADWVSNGIITDSPKPGSAMKIMLMNWKEDLDEVEKLKFLQALDGIKDQYKEIEYISYGQKYEFNDPSDNKEYRLLSIFYFHGVKDLEAFNSDAQLQKLLQEKMNDSVKTESQVVVDYMVHLPK